MHLVAAGGGFHRYSVDEHFHIPHFEKVSSPCPNTSSAASSARRPAWSSSSSMCLSH